MLKGIGRVLVPSSFSKVEGILAAATNGSNCLVSQNSTNKNRKNNVLTFDMLGFRPLIVDPKHIKPAIAIAWSKRLCM